MAGSSFGTIFKVTTWGESHGKALGVVVDGVPAGMSLCEEDVQALLDERRPGASKYATKRAEADRVSILSGIFEGRTTGTPVMMMVENSDQHSSDYSVIADVYRPGHADYTYDKKYGFRDYRGGGRSSGRETIGRVCAGAVALKLLDAIDVKVTAYAASIAGIDADPKNFDPKEIEKNPFRLPDAAAAEAAARKIDRLIAEKESAGGIIECVTSGVTAGIGDPVFEKLDANLSKAVMSIGAVKGVEIGDGFSVCSSTGSKNNDEFESRDGKIIKKTNHSGGMLGGISDGSDIIIRAAVKPTPSIARQQQTVNRSGENVDISIKGRHDPLIVPRAVVVVKSMVAVTLADALLCGMGARMSDVVAFYKH